MASRQQAFASADRAYNEDVDSDGPVEKDEDEKKLEKLLFGDAATFQGALKGHEVDSGALVKLLDSDAESVESDEGNDEGLAGVDDTDLFFFDTGIAAAGEESPFPGADISVSIGQDLRSEADHFAVWEDSDDERLRISLAGNDRLRKLRLTAVEDVISGKDYVRRLRKQFERLQPAPEWATETGGRSAKRRKTNRSAATGNDSDPTSDEEHEEREGEEHMSSKPLALLLQNATNLTRDEDSGASKGKRNLRAEVLDIERLKDVGGNQPSSIDSLCFHPSYPLLLSSGPASTLFLHHVSAQSATPNPLLTSLHVRRTPIHTSAFSSPSGDRIFFSGRRRYFHIWDLDSGKIEKINGTADRREEQKSMERFKLSPCGRWMGVVGSTKKGGGIITILNATTLQWVSQIRIDSRGGVADFAWWRDGEGLCVVGKNGEVSEWDNQEKRVVARWVDEGAVGTTVLSLGGRSGRHVLGGDRWIAIGSSSGIVNIYDRRPWAEAAMAAKRVQANDPEEDVQFGIPRQPKPTRMLDQLTTPISHLVFSNDGQLMVMGSRWKRDALRLVHLPSCTVYKNWPTSSTPFGRISAVAIAPTSRTLAVANEQGKIRLWEIHG